MSTSGLIIMSEPQGEYQTAEVIRFQATVNKVQTLVDGGVRVSLDLVMPAAPETIVALFDAKQPGIILECACVAVDQDAMYKHKGNNANRSKRISAGE